MKVTGIVAEFNPFHNGHKYLVEQAKKNNSDLVIVVMSGEFLQSGELAFASKELRTQLALKAGVDLVFLLPSVYSTGSAEIFATGAISILDSLACVDELIFGSEFEEVDALMELAKILNTEPEDYTKILQYNLKLGRSFPAARSLAICEYLKDDRFSKILSSPNSILGIEYCRALLKLNSKIKPIAIRRTDEGYHSTDTNSNNISATAIRNLYNGTENGPDLLVPYVPDCLTKIYSENFNLQYPVLRNDVLPYLFQKLFSRDFENSTVYELSEDLKNRILNTIKSDFSADYETFVRELNSKNTTYGHISRVFAHLILNIKEKPEAICPYARILGFSNSGKQLLHVIKGSSQIPLITNVVQGKKQLSQLANNIKATEYFETDLLAYNIYHIILKQKYNTKFIPESSLAFMSWNGEKNE